VLSYGTHPSTEAEKYSESVTTDALLGQSDIIFLHCPLKAQNYHMIDSESIAKMKDGVFLVNTARGGLVDAQAVLEALLKGKMAGYGFDVYENEAAFLRKNVGLDAVDAIFRALLGCKNAFFTAHTAFYTDIAIESMIRVTLDNLKEYEQTGKCRNEVY
ncbi:MAG TPA: NAD(P)-dependent oxidoreductase, partial [Clostridia bacterium]|nr:NAD(P)-dependent oxidoreductase [Clostridia bacterium]